MPVAVLTRFNDSIGEHLWAGHKVGDEYRRFFLCDVRQHFECSIPIGQSPRKAWSSAKAVGDCDGACTDGYQISGRTLPWSVQEVVGVKVTIPRGYVLVHQRYAHDGRPYFKIFHREAAVCPAMAEEGILLLPGASTIVLMRERRGVVVKAILVINAMGVPRTELVASTVETVHNLAS